MKNLLTAIIMLFFAGLLYQPEKSVGKAGGGNHFASSLNELHTGDVVLRLGKGFISELFRKSSMHHQRYSHAGVVQVTGDGVFVVHVLGDSYTQGTDLIKEPIADFCNSLENRSYAVFRYPFLTGKEPAVSSYLNQLALGKIQFDEQFDLSSDTALYCTEFVYKICLSVANYQLPVTDINGRKYVGLDDLYHHSQAKLITSQTY